MKKLFLLYVAIGCIGAAYGATAAKGVFSVAANKKVQFANANSVYSENELIQWANLGAATDAGWDVQLKFYSPSLKRIFNASTTFAFSNDTQLGSIAEPYTPSWNAAN